MLFAAARDHDPVSVAAPALEKAPTGPLADFAGKFDTHAPSSDAPSPTQFRPSGMSLDTVPVAARDLLIRNMRGLHARASSKFVKTVAEFDAEVTVSRDGQSVGGQSIMGLMMLAAHQGSSIHVEARGADAEAVLDALDTLVADRFGEGE
jgi:phosphocarrier protein